MDLKAKEQAIVDDFSVYDDWMDKYEYIIDLGKSLPKMNTIHKIEKNLIDGCQSKVWLHAMHENGKINFLADADAIITKGMIAILIQALDGEAPDVIAKADLAFLSKIGLHEHLSPTRANGLLSMVKKIKLLALENVAKKVE